jgi:hypothetical protein
LDFDNINETKMAKTKVLESRMFMIFLVPIDLIFQNVYLTPVKKVLGFKGG